MPQMKFFLPFCLIFIGLSMLGKSQTTDLEMGWSQSYPYQQGHINDCLIVENQQGQIAAFAKTNDQQLFFLEVDLGGNILAQHILAAPKSIFKNVIASHKGYLIVGQHKIKGKWAPALWKYQKGDKELQLVTNITQKGSFNDLLLNGSGEVIITGRVDEQMCLYRFDPNLETIKIHKSIENKIINRGNVRGNVEVVIEE